MKIENIKKIVSKLSLLLKIMFLNAKENKMKVLLVCALFISYFTLKKIINYVFFDNQSFYEANKDSFIAENVIVLHGITKTNRIMKHLSKSLSEHGFNVYNITYPSTEYTIQELAEFVYNKAYELGLNDRKKTHFVGHSMGGLIIRHFIYKFKPENIGRVVMIGTPNHGSQLTDKFKDWWLYKKDFGTKAGRQIGTDMYGLKNAFGKVDYELGIIAGNKNGNPYFSKILPNEDDGMVTVESTKLEGMKEHIILKLKHNQLVSNKKSIRQVIYFLRNGYFEKK